MKTLLIGLRGSGKSTVGARIAEALGLDFIDLDERVRRSFGGVDIATIFEERGETAFRSQEATEFARAMGEDGEAVVALGGGTPTAPGVSESIEAHRATGEARVIYLRAEPDTLVRRLGEHGLGDNRPSLTGGDALDEMAEVFAQRDAMYRALADEVVDASPGLEAVVGDVLGIVRG